MTHRIGLIVLGLSLFWPGTTFGSAKAKAAREAANQSFRRAATRAQIFAGFMGPLTNFVNNLGLAILGGITLGLVGLSKLTLRATANPLEPSRAA